MRAVAFDAMGVLYEEWDDMRQLLVPFARNHGSSLTDREIHRTYRKAMLGQLTTSELWNALGVMGDGPSLNEEYLKGYHLRPGIHLLLDELRDEGIELGCISNDVAEWSSARCVAHGLDGHIKYWTISSEVRARKPEEAIYRAFLVSTGLQPADVVFVDDRTVNVDAAVALGFRGILVDLAQLGNDPSVPRTIGELGDALTVRR